MTSPQKFRTPEEAVATVADEIETFVKCRALAGKMLTLGLSAGDVSIFLYQELVRRHRDTGLSFKNVVTFNLDEYCDIPATEPGSVQFFMRKHFFSQVDINPENTHFLDGTVTKSARGATCVKYEEAIRAAGGIDLQIIRMGSNGQIGLNEAPAGPDSASGPIRLSEQTRNALATRLGADIEMPHESLTLGLGSILAAHRILVLAWGQDKAATIQRALHAAPDVDCPASWMQYHANCTFMLDDAAASQIKLR